MPADYAIDLDRGVMVTTLVGWVSRVELVALIRNQMADPRAPLVSRHLVDARALISHGLGLEDVAGLFGAVRWDLSRRRQGARMRTALAVGSGLLISHALVLDALGAAAGDSALFFDMDRASRWLGLPDLGARSGAVAGG